MEEKRSGLKFLETYGSKASADMYRYGIKDYLNKVYDPNVGYADLAAAVEGYFSNARDYKADVELFFTLMKERPPKTVKQRMAITKIFLLENGVELPQAYWRRLRSRTKGTRALTIDRVPSNAELKQVMQYLPIHGKALFSILASSGMRIGEALQLKAGDVDLGKSPARATLRGGYTKSGNWRYAFINEEAVEAIKAWLAVRGNYLEAASGRSWRVKKSLDDARLLPFSECTAYMMWYGAVQKAGMLEHDPSTGHISLHPHVLRKFFRTRMGAVMQLDVVEALMGHEGYLTEAYRRYSAEDLAKLYQEHSHVLAVFSNGQDAARIRAEYEEGNKQLIKALQDLAAESRAKQQELEGKLKKQDERMDRIFKRLMIEKP